MTTSIARTLLLSVISVFFAINGRLVIADDNLPSGDEQLLKKFEAKWKERQASTRTAQITWRQLVHHDPAVVSASIANDKDRLTGVEQGVGVLAIGDGLNIRHELRPPQTPEETTGDFPVRKAAATSAYDGVSNQQFTSAEAGNSDDWPRGIIWKDSEYDELRNYHLRALILHYRPLYSTIELAAHRFDVISRETLDGHKCVVIKTKVPGPGGMTDTYWVDLDRDYVILKHVEGAKGRPSAQLSIKYTRDPEVDWRPVAWKLEFTSGTLHATGEVITHAINQPLPPDTFDLSFPPGTLLFDRDAGFRYLILPTGKKRRITPEESAQGFNYRELFHTRAGDLEKLQAPIGAVGRIIWVLATLFVLLLVALYVLYFRLAKLR